MTTWMKTLGAALTLSAAAAAPAEAGTLYVSEASEGTSCCEYFSVRYTAAAGEANRVTATIDSVTGIYTLTDPGAAAITPDPDSEAADWCTFSGTTVTCETVSRYREYYGVILGDGDDTSLTSTPVETWVDGGPGNDTLTHTGSTGAFLFGGLDDDRLSGGGGGDELRGGHGADVMDGRDGTDTVTYHAYDPSNHSGTEAQAPTTGVSVSLDGVADDGAPGEHDDVSASNERVHGTIFDDVLVGGRGDQFLAGYEGDDRFEGGPGFDVYSCGAGHDTVTSDRWDGLYAALYPSYECEVGAPVSPLPAAP